MPNTFTENRDRWLQLSEVDYLGQFVKAWLAFNAWYRGAYEEGRDRAIIEEIKWNPNPIASRFRPMLGQTSEEAEQFRTQIGLLHHRLERYEIHAGKGQGKRRIRMSNVVIRNEPSATDHFTFRNYNCKVERVQNGDVTVVVTRPDSTAAVNLYPHKFDLETLVTDPQYNLLTENLKTRCRRCYNAVNPRIERDLTEGDSEEILCGTHRFRCGAEYLFAGVLEVIYLLRCSLFHGELVPTREASDCYEPAYRIVRTFLESVT